MLKDLIPQFAEVVKNNPRLIADNYELKEGIYIRIPLNIHFSEKKINYVIVGKKQDDIIGDNELLKWFKTMDRQSSVLRDDMNKSLDLPARKIHSTHAFTLFWKKDYVFGKDGEADTDTAKKHLIQFLETSIPKADDRIYELYPIKARKKAEREAEERIRDTYFKTNFKELFDYSTSKNRAEQKQQVIYFWKENFEIVFDIIRNLVKQYNVKNYIKVFFDLPIHIYEQENDLYLLPRIFNANSYNELLQNNIIGLPAYDVSMNAKKPFLEMKTRKTDVPTRVTLEEAHVMKDFYQWLQRQGKFREIDLPFHELFGPGSGQTEKSRDVAKGAYYLSLDKNGSIDYYENVPFSPNETWTLNIENILERKEKAGQTFVIKSYEPIYKKKSLREVINKLFFNGYMPRNLLDQEAPKAVENIFTIEMVSIYTITRQALFDYLVKDTKETIRPFVKKYALKLIENQILQTTKGLSFQKQADAYHLYLALLKDIEKEEGAEMSDKIKSVYDTLKSKLQQNEGIVVCESDKEFFFLAGQLGYYLLSQSEVAIQNKNYGLAEPILKARNALTLQNKLSELFDTYKHAIRMNYGVFNQAMAMVQGYETDAKIVGHNRHMLIAGLCANNLFYQKSEINENKGDE